MYICTVMLGNGERTVLFKSMRCIRVAQVFLFVRYSSLFAIFFSTLDAHHISFISFFLLFCRYYSFAQLHLAHATCTKKNVFRDYGKSLLCCVYIARARFLLCVSIIFLYNRIVMMHPTTKMQLWFDSFRWIGCVYIWHHIICASLSWMLYVHAMTHHCVNILPNVPSMVFTFIFLLLLLLAICILNCDQRIYIALHFHSFMIFMYVISYFLHMPSNVSNFGYIKSK